MCVLRTGMLTVSHLKCNFRNYETILRGILHWKESKHCTHSSNKDESGHAGTCKDGNIIWILISAR
jgi:hypothetical protein